MPIKKTALLSAAAATLVSGCTTIVSKPLPTEESGATTPANYTSHSFRNTKGIIYFLPKRQIKVTASQKPVNAKAVADAKETVTKAKAAEATATATLGATSASLKKEEAVLAAMETPTSKQQDKITRLKAQQKVEQKAVADASTARQAAEKQLQTRKTAKINGLPEFTISAVLTDPIPDPSKAFQMYFHHSIQRDDEFSISVNKKGLLTSGKVTAADRTGDIIVEVAGAIAGLGRGDPLPARAGGTPPATCHKDFYDEIEYNGLFDMDDIEEVNGELARCFPFKITLEPALRLPEVNNSREPGDKDNQKPDDDGNQKPDDDNTTWQNETPNTSIYDLNKSVPSDGSGKIRGLVHRANLPYTLTVEECDLTGYPNDYSCRGDYYPRQTSIVMMPNDGPMGVIPFKSSMFVTTVDEVTFEDGIVTSWNRKAPSELLEIVRLPIKIAKEVISVPAELVQLKIDLSSKEAKLDSALQAQIIANETLKSLQTCLATAGEDQEAVNACLEASTPPATSGTE